MRQKQINKMLSSIKSRQKVYNEYGKVFKVMWWHIVFVIDRFIPTVSIPTIIAKKYLDFEAFRITTSNK